MSTYTPSLPQAPTMNRIGSLDEIFYLCILGLVWVALIIAIHPLGNFPLNDDWVYGLAVKSVLENGYYQFPSPSSANVGPMVYWGALFCLPGGFSFTALRLSTLTLGLLGIFAMYGLSRSLGAAPKLALLGGLILAVNPLYLGLAHSFMTDVPFLTVVIFALWALVKALKQDSLPWLIAGLALAFMAIMIRQLGIVVLVGFAAAYLTKHGFRVINMLKVAALVFAGVALHLGYQDWLVDTGRTPLLTYHADADRLHVPTVLMAVKKFLIMVLYAGFFILPVLPALLSLNENVIFQRKKTFWLTAAAVAAFFVLLVLADNLLPLTGNNLLESGLGPLTLRDTYNSQINFPAIPWALKVFWGVLTFFSVIAGSFVLYFLSRVVHQSWIRYTSQDRNSLPPIMLLFGTALSYLGILMIITGSFPVFDRYYLVFLPVFFLLIVTLYGGKTIKSWGYKISWAIILFYALFSVAATHDYLAWSRARWQAVNDLMRAGVKPEQIDGGYEFNGWYLYHPNYKVSRTKSWWWVIDDEYILASGPIEGYALARRYTFDRWFLQRTDDVLVLRRIARH